MAYVYCLLLLVLNIGTKVFAAPELKGGWYLFDPYQYTKINAGSETLTGLDIELQRAVAQEAGYDIKLSPIGWSDHQQALKGGTLDIAAGATYTAERAEFAYYTDPYRYEENALFVAKEMHLVQQKDNIEEFLKSLKDKKFRLGVVEGFIYADPAINKYIEAHQNTPLIVIRQNTQENLNLLLKGKIDGFLADRIVGATFIWRQKVGSHIKEINLGLKTPIHFMLSKQSVTPEVVTALNKAIATVKATEKYENIISWYLYPVLLLQTIQSDWFAIVVVIGTIAFAISGLVIAYQEKASLLGALIYAILPSVGGGIMRDVIFDRSPIGFIETPRYIIIVLVTVTMGYALLKLRGIGQRLLSHKAVLSPKLKSIETWVAAHVLQICDGLGLASFTVSGVAVTTMAKVSPLWLWGPFFALLTGAGGGILRDLISRRQVMVTLADTIYAEVALLWGFIFSLFLHFQSVDWNPDHIHYAVIITIIGAFITRMAFYFLRVPNLQFRE